MNDNTSREEQDKARWRLSLEELLKNAEDAVIITTYRREWNSSARPVLARGIDKCEYVVKGQQAGRQIINDQIVARLGLAIGAPVGKPQIVEISPDLLDENLQQSTYPFQGDGYNIRTLFYIHLFVIALYFPAVL